LYLEGIELALLLSKGISCGETPDVLHGKENSMRIPKNFRNCCVLVLSLMLSHLPQVAIAESQMIPTAQVAEEMSRAEAQAQVETFLKKPELREALIARGISPDEASSRLAALSDSELRQMATEMNSAQYGGDILLAILLVVLIIYFAKRI
jgi:hypothetical protein